MPASPYLCQARLVVAVAARQSGASTITKFPRRSCGTRCSLCGMLVGSRGSRWCFHTSLS
jgi:hypothetical protein